MATSTTNETSETNDDPRGRLIAWLESLPADALADLGRRYAEASARGGATMQRPSGDILPIPPLLTPEVASAAELAATEDNAHSILAGLSRMSRWLMTSGEASSSLRARVTSAFGPLENRALAAAWAEAERIATCRVDYLVDREGRPRALEVNATIPAMQGYSDIVAHAFLDEVARDRGLPAGTAARLLDENGRNSDQLLASLLAHYRLLEGPRALEHPRIAIVARAGDSQSGELRHLARRFTTLGCPTSLHTPDHVTLAGGGARLVVTGTDGASQDHHDGAPFTPDLVYRHVFLRRLDEGSDFARALLDPRRHRILNPGASHLEIKAMLGLLSAACDPHDREADRLASDAGLDDDARAEVARSVPWTRLLSATPTRGPGGESIPDLLAEVIASPDRFVLKKSWDYGGRSVFLGFAHDESAAVRAAEVIHRPHPPTWAELARHAASDPGDAWVVQERIFAGKRRHLTAGRGPTSIAPEGEPPTWKDLYVDLSVYTNLGVDTRPRGGVTRAATGLIVNLQSGGGLAPLLSAEVIAKLMA